MNPIENLFKLQTLELFKGAPDPAAIQLRSQIPEPLLAHYDRFMTRGKAGVALVRNQVCSGCHIRIPIGTLNMLLHNEDFQLCANCGRYLYLPAGNTSAPRPTGPKRGRKHRVLTAAA